MSSRYQEVWIRGLPVDSPHQRECASRYAVIKKQLEGYDRPFSVLDLGANMAYFSVRIAEDFPQATVLAIDDKEDLKMISRENRLENLIVCQRRMTGAELLRLAKCEAIDVVLCLNVLHHIPDWDLSLEAIRLISKTAIIETPQPGDTGAANPGRLKEIYERVKGLSSRVILRSPSHTTRGAERIMMIVENPSTKSPVMQTLDAEERRAPAMSDIVVFLDDQVFMKNGQKRDYHPGFNLWNIALMNCIWPTDLGDRIKAEAEGKELDDPMPWNFVISGGRAVAIDVGYKNRPPVKGALQRCLDLLSGVKSQRGPIRF